MAFEKTGRGMVAGDCQHVRLLSEQNRQRFIKILNGFALSGKIPVLAIHVCVFIMNEEIIVVIIFAQISLHLLADRLRPFQFGHPHQLRQAFIHGYTAMHPARSL